MDEAVTKYEKLEPPEEFKGIHGQYVGALRNVGDQADAVERAAEQNDKPQIRQALTSFNQALREGSRIGDDFDKQVGTT